MFETGACAHILRMTEQNTHVSYINGALWWALLFETSEYAHVALRNAKQNAHIRHFSKAVEAPPRLRLVCKLTLVMCKPLKTTVPLEM